jgi:hypothetical protein
MSVTDQASRGSIPTAPLTIERIAVTLKEAAQMVPFSEPYLRQAIHRTNRNHLPARQAGGPGGKYYIMVEDLVQWLRDEGEPT